MNEVTSEIWKDIEGYEGLYQVSNHGRVKSLQRVTIDKNGKKYNRKGKILSPFCREYGYLAFTLIKNNKTATYQIHRLVAEAFIPNPNNLPQVNHINGHPSCNSVENLEWVSIQENIADKVTHERQARGETSGLAKLTEENVKWIRANYIPRDKHFGTRAIARKFGISNVAVSLIVRNKHWKHIL